MYFVSTGIATSIYNVSLTEYTIRVFDGVWKIIEIIENNPISIKIFSTFGGTIYNDVGYVFIWTLNKNQRYTIQSHGTDWIVIGQ